MAKKLEGIIISTKMSRAIVVKVERTYRHHLYKKIVKRHKNYKARTDDNDLIVGDKVRIIETRPLSKEIHFKVMEKINI